MLKLNWVLKMSLCLYLLIFHLQSLLLSICSYALPINEIQNYNHVNFGLSIVSSRNLVIGIPNTLGSSTLPKSLMIGLPIKSNQDSGEMFDLYISSFISYNMQIDFQTNTHFEIWEIFIINTKKQLSIKILININLFKKLEVCTCIAS